MLKLNTKVYLGTNRYVQTHTVYILTDSTNRMWCLAAQLEIRDSNMCQAHLEFKTYMLIE